jgi:hypothetical protein
MNLGHVQFSLSFAILSAGAVSGCAIGDGPTDEAVLPRVTGLGTTEASVGEDVYIHGENFVDPTTGWVDVTFRGDFITATGRHAVDLVVPLLIEGGDTTTLRWHDFGAYRVPFGPGYEIGRFEGQVTATNRYWDGSSDVQPLDTARLITIDVKPSIVVVDYLAMGDTWIADCREPATNILGLVPYMMRVRALGFEAESFTFELSEGLLVDREPTTDITQIEVFPDDGEYAVRMQWAAVPDASEGYSASIGVRATSDRGERYSLNYKMLVRRPLEVYFTSLMDVAQLYEPVPVTGCIPGGMSSVQTAYREEHSETRSLTESHDVSSGWEHGYGTEHSQTWDRSVSEGGSATAQRAVTMTDARTEGGAESVTDTSSWTRGRTRDNSVDFTQNSSGEWGWSVNDEEYGEDQRSNEAEGGLNAVVKLGGSSQWGWVDGDRHARGWTGGGSNSTGSRRGSSSGTSFSQTEAQARSRSAHWERTQSYAETNSYAREENWSTTLGYSRGVSESETLSTTFNETIGMSRTISTTDTVSRDTTAWVWAGMQGMWYRQTTRLQRDASVVAYDLCGNGSEVGVLSIDDWTWAADLGIGDSCPPPSNFPPAECRVAHCDPR